MHSNLVIEKAMRSNLKWSTYVIYHNSNSNSDLDNDREFVNFNLHSNK